MTALANAGAARLPLQRLSERIAEWLPTILLAYPLLVWPILFGVPESTRGPFDLPAPAQESNLVNQLLFPGALAAAMAASLCMPLARLQPLRHPALLLIGLFLLWASASMLWTLEPGITLRRVIVQTCVVGVLVLSALAARHPERLLAHLFALVAVAVLVNVAMVVVNPAGPLGHEGIYTHKNVLGAAGALFVFLALHAIVTGGPWRRILAMGVLLATLALLFVSRSKTSFILAVAVPVVAGGVLFVSRAFRISPAVQTVLTLAVLLIGFDLGERLFLWDFDLLAELLFGDPTITGRTEIWEFAWAMIERRPWLGFGYESFWLIGYESPSFREAPGFVAQMPHAHSGYLDMLLHTGIPGLLIVLAMTVAALHAAGARRIPPGLAWLLLCIILYSLIHNLVETSWFRGYDFTWMAFVLAVALAARYRCSNG